MTDSNLHEDMTRRARVLLGKVVLAQVPHPEFRLQSVRFDPVGIRSVINLCRNDFMRSFPAATESEVVRSFVSAMAEVVYEAVGWSNSPGMLNRGQSELDNQNIGSRESGRGD